MDYDKYINETVTKILPGREKDFERFRNMHCNYFRAKYLSPVREMDEEEKQLQVDKYLLACLIKFLTH